MKILVYTVCISSLIGLSVFAKTGKEIQRQPNAETSKGKAEFVLQGKYSFLRLEGDAAKSMFTALKAQAKADNEGAGPNTFFKYGKSYRCFAEADDEKNPSADKLNSFVCDIAIANPETGTTK